MCECWHSGHLPYHCHTNLSSLRPHGHHRNRHLPIDQAARLVGAEPRALRRWLQGYSRKYNGERVHSEPLWETQLKDEGLPEDVIGFRDLLELRMVSALSVTVLT